MPNIKTLFTEEEIEFSINDVTLSSSLVLPQKTKYPCAIMLSGYGPVTRDNTTSDFKRYKVLAEQLAKKGIASLRFDDRGSGKSTDVNWHDYTFDDLADEALAAYSFVKNNSNIDSKRIGFVGHSLGGFIGPLAASKSGEIAFVVSAAPHGLVGIETAIHTRNAMAKSVGESKEETIKWSKIIRNTLEDLRDQRTEKNPLGSLKEALLEKYQGLPSELKVKFPTFESYLEPTFERYLLVLGDTPMYRSFLSYNPQEAYKRLKCPTLLLFAGSDLMHPSNVHKDAIKSAMNTSARNDVTIHDFPQANHNFTKVKGQNDLEFVKNFSETIINWIVKLL